MTALTERKLAPSRRMRILICGSRTWTDRERMRKFVEALPDDTVVIHGAASGSRHDRRGGSQAPGADGGRVPEQWSRYGRAAGPIRNRQMLKQGRPDRVAVAHDNFTASHRTRDMVEQAIAAGIPVERIL
jgi:hypothetical protein